MTKSKYDTLVAGVFSLSTIIGCDSIKDDENALVDDAWLKPPAGIHPFGGGYPEEDDQCRRIGESELTIDWLDHTRVLIACPGSADSADVMNALELLKGTLIMEVEGFSVISAPNPWPNQISYLT